MTTQLNQSSQSRNKAPKLHILDIPDILEAEYQTKSPSIARIEECKNVFQPH